MIFESHFAIQSLLLRERQSIRETSQDCVPAVHVARVGAWLTAVRDRKQHGEWLPWLADNCPEISQRTAYNYIETYEKLNGTNLQLVANLPVTQAYRELCIVKDPTDPTPVETPPLAPLWIESSDCKQQDDGCFLASIIFAQTVEISLRTPQS